MAGTIATRSLGLVLAFAAMTGSACAMSSVSNEGFQCTVEGTENLPAELGGEAGVCAAIQRVALPQLQKSGIAPDSVAVRVLVKSKYMFSAVVFVKGQPRPERNVAISDRPLNSRAVEMLANAVAGELAK